MERTSRHAAVAGAAAIATGLVAALAGPAGAVDEGSIATVAPAGLRPADPAVAAAADGAQLVAFTARVGAGHVVAVRARPRAGGPWGRVTPVSAPSARRPPTAAVAMGPSGTAIVVWRTADGDLESAVRAGPSASWVRAPVGAAPGEPGDLAVSAGATDGVAAWAVGTGAQRSVAVAVLDVATRRWRAEAPLAAAGPPAIAAGPRGHVVAAWSGTPGSPSADLVQAARRHPSTGWEPTASLAAGGDGSDASIASDGTASVIWRERASERVLSAFRASPAAGWAAPEDVGTAGLDAPRIPRIAVNAGGDAVATWLGPGATTLLARQRRGSDGAWGPARRLVPAGGGGGGAAPVAIDDLGNGFIQWIDPEGPGSASLLAWVAPGRHGVPESARDLPVGGDVEQLALAADGRGDALMATTRSLAVSSDLDTDIVAAPLRLARCRARPTSPTNPEPGTTRLSASQLRINQRISSAAIRRADAIGDWLDGGIEARDLCAGGLVPSAFGPAIAFGPPPPRGEPSAPDPRPVVIRDPEPKRGVEVTLSVQQLRINQRIASRAVRQANALQARIDRGLTGGDLEPRAVSAAAIAPTAAVTGALPTPTPPPSRTVIRFAAEKAEVRFTLTAEQLLINQRISQAAIRRLNALRERIAGGLTAESFRASSITEAALSPSAEGS